MTNHRGTESTEKKKHRENKSQWFLAFDLCDSCDPWLTLFPLFFVFSVLSVPLWLDPFCGQKRGRVSFTSACFQTSLNRRAAFRAWAVFFCASRAFCRPNSDQPLLG
jgi:hypothetical protein